MTAARARYERQSMNPTTRRHVDDPRISLLVDRGLKSGKRDEIRLTPSEARVLATELLVAAERYDGRNTGSLL